MPRKQTRNDSDRSQWIDNDEGLYNWWRGSRQSKREFIRENRAELDAAIDRALGGSRPAHEPAPNPYASPAARMVGRAGQSLLPR